MKLTNKELETICRWMYREARPIDLARWQYHFENGTQSKVIQLLSAYQNSDGGFGHGLEADSANPNSTPIQTWCATELLEEVGFDETTHPIIQGILDYLEKTEFFKNNQWLAEIPSNNDYPGAPWWKYDEKVSDWEYNPTASLVGFVLKHSAVDSLFHRQARNIAIQAIESYLQRQPLDDMHECYCYLTLEKYCREAEITDLFDLDKIQELLTANVSRLITTDATAWATSYVCKPSQFFISPDSPYYLGNERITQTEYDFIIRDRNREGIWDITWNWGCDADAFAIANLHWKSTIVIRNMLFLRNFNRLSSIRKE